MVDVLIVDQAIPVNPGRRAGLKDLEIRRAGEGCQFRPWMLVQILARHVEALPAGDLRPEQAIAETQGLGFDIEQDQVAEHEAEFERVDLLAPRIGPIGPFAIPVGMKPPQQRVVGSHGIQRDGRAIGP